MALRAGGPALALLLRGRLSLPGPAARGHARLGRSGTAAQPAAEEPGEGRRGSRGRSGLCRGPWGGERQCPRPGPGEPCRARAAPPGSEAGPCPPRLAESAASAGTRLVERRDQLGVHQVTGIIPRHPLRQAQQTCDRRCAFSTSRELVGVSSLLCIRAVLRLCKGQQSQKVSGHRIAVLAKHVQAVNQSKITAILA